VVHSAHTNGFSEVWLVYTHRAHITCESMRVLTERSSRSHWRYSLIHSAFISPSAVVGTCGDTHSKAEAAAHQKGARGGVSESLSVHTEEVRGVRAARCVG